MNYNLFISFSVYCGIAAIVFLISAFGMRLVKCCQNKIKNMKKSITLYKLTVSPNGYSDIDIDDFFLKVGSAINIGKIMLANHWGGEILIYPSNANKNQCVKIIQKEGLNWRGITF